MTAPLNTLQERCQASATLLAHIGSQRYGMHLPYYRMERELAARGLPISRQTMSNWMGMTADASRLVVDRIAQKVFADGYGQIDESPVRYLDPGGGRAPVGWLWVIHNPARKISSFVWRLGRGACHLEQIVPAGWRGVIQCDAMGAYPSFAKQGDRNGHISLAGCLAHVRRKFHEARAEGADAVWVLEQMRQLYAIEAELREQNATPEDRLRMRQQRSVPIMTALRERLEELKKSHKHLPRSLTGAAMSYALNHWEKLLVFLKDGRVEIDNNLVENAIRPTAIGRKNWLFLGDAQAGHRTATYMTLLNNCRSAGVDPYTYLKDLFTRLPSATTRTVHTLTPNAWALEQKARREAIAPVLATAVLG